MNLQLQGKRALVTGASGGIGEAIARRLAEEGAAVAVHGRKEGEVDRVVQAIRQAGGQAVRVLGDLTRDEDVRELAEAARRALDGVDVLVNSAGTYVDSSWDEATPDDWLRVYDTNVVSAVRLVRELAPDMRRAGWGRIVQIASGEATQPFAFMADYAAGKAALVNLTVSLAKALAGSGITVNTVSPGIVVTGPLERFYRDQAARRGWGSSWPEVEAGVLRDVLPNSTGRLGRPVEVADLVTFVSSPLAGYISGANLRI